MSDEHRSSAAAAPPAGRQPLNEPLSLRVGFASERAQAALGEAVDATTVSSPGQISGLGLLVVGSEDGSRELCGEARRSGVPVAAFVTGPGDDPPDADILIGAPVPGVLPTAPSLDPERFNPSYFDPTGAAGIVALITRDGTGFEDAYPLLASTAHDEPLTVLAPERASIERIPPGSRLQAIGDVARPAKAARLASERLAVLDHPAFHASELERAGWIAKLSACGVPVCCEGMTDGLRELLGAELSGLLEPLRARDMADLDLRERTSVAVRRAALRDHSASARWRQVARALGIELPGRPMVSVILSTRRESWLEHGVAQVTRQTYEPRELVVCLHGDEFGEGTSERIRELYPGECQVIRVDEELTLGDALNTGVEASNGELVTKMDDDDYYSTEHLWDLVLALEYSRADLVGKGAEFVYLQWVDLTMRRFMGDGESEHPRLAGGALMARKEPLQAIGGWPSRSRGEDTWIVKNMKASGRKSYRTHGFGYILNRHGQGHTWNTYVDYFLIQSQREWRGLSFAESAIEPGADAVAAVQPG